MRVTSGRSYDTKSSEHSEHIIIYNIINKYKDNSDINVFTSLPLPNSKSGYLLEKIGFIKQDNKYKTHIKSNISPETVESKRP